MASTVATAERVEPFHAGTDIPVDFGGRWQVRGEANPRLAILQANLDEGLVATFRLGTRAAPQVAGGRADLDIAAGVAGRWLAHAGHVKLEVTFAGIPAITKLQVDATLSGGLHMHVDWRTGENGERVGGEVAILDAASSRRVAELPRPWIEYDPDDGGDRVRRDLDWSLLVNRLTIELPDDLSATEWATALLDPTVVATSTASTATAYSNQRKIDRCQNGVLWAHTIRSSNSQAYFSYSTDDGATWTDDAVTYLADAAGNSSSSTAYVPNSSIFIDLDDYCHWVYKHNSNGYIYYRRGTPNAGRTAWTWSAATTISTNTNDNYPDVVAHREGTGWRAHVTSSHYPGVSFSQAQYQAVAITSGGVISLSGSQVVLGFTNSAGAHPFPSIDFNHTGDAKTVAGSTPHLYVAWSNGTTGSGQGIRFKKATYSGGTWTWGTEREIDSTRYVLSVAFWMNCLFDGTRVVISGLLYDGTNNDLVLYDRDAADTATTARALLDNSSASEMLFYGSASYDSVGDVYLFGRNNDEAAGTRDLVYRKWTRTTTTLGAEVVIDSGVGDTPYVSAKRGYSDGRIEFVYTDGTASPYEVKYSFVGDEPELYPAPVATSTAATATAYSNQRKIDRCQNGVLWAVSHDVDPASFANPVFASHSTDNGATWSAPASGRLPGDIGAGSNGLNYSFFIDLDDYAHFAYKRPVDGYIYYRRGTPNAGRTAWTWSAATTVASSSTAFNYPDVIAHREGTGWRAHIVFARDGNTDTQYARINITSAGAISLAATPVQIGNYSGTNPTWPSIDFHHTGDGKTVAGGTPHLYAAWSAGATGAGKGIRFKKATYSGGSWTWGTEREIDSARYISTASNHWLNCLFDGTRVLVGGSILDATSFTDVVLHERDAADTTTTTRNLADNSTALLGGSLTYDGDGNVYIFGRDMTGSAGSRVLGYAVWTRATSTLGSKVTVDASGNDAPYVSAKRGYSNGRIEFVYTDGTSSPYTVTFGEPIILNAPPDVSTDLVPNGATIASTGTNRFDWTFVDPDAADTQAAYELRYRPVGGEWTTVAGTTDTHHDFAAGTFTAGEWQWEVRTSDGSGFGAWSATAAFDVVDTIVGSQATVAVTAGPGTPGQGLFGTQALVTSGAHAGTPRVTLPGAQAAVAVAAQAGSSLVAVLGAQVDVVATALAGSPRVNRYIDVYRAVARRRWGSTRRRLR